MAASKTAAKAVPYLERLLENDYVQDNLLAGVSSLREAGSALKTGRERPKRSTGRRVLLLVVLGAGGAFAVRAMQGAKNQEEGS